jgi:predicted aminopeptidase
MGIVGTIINALVVLAVGGILAWVTVDRSRHLRRELEAKISVQTTRIDDQVARISDQVVRTDHLEARMEAGFAAMQDRMDAGFAAMQDRMDAGFAAMQDRMDRMINAVRSDLTAVALAVGAPTRPRPV